ncbi:hypothetical protein RZS28_00905 [Methylocapsa polymorpha]|uniref:Uncharacterized protein n=1 Tax=Methylocapsa polymorpha TaxID=3080828 RepID=A0ABZ0HRH1_9HYPH|nr:hypothetical protein RZS28_00905 [Methylocapsa sp. RX1]
MTPSRSPPGIELLPKFGEKLIFQQLGATTMTESNIPAANTGSPDLDRRSIVRSIGAAATGGAILGALAQAAQASPAVSPDLLQLIEAHRRATAAETAAWKAHDAADGCFKALCKSIDYTDGAFDFRDLERTKKHIAAVGDYEEIHLKMLKIYTTPAMQERFADFWREILQDRKQYFEEVCAKVEENRVASGFAAAESAVDEACAAKDAACLDLCSYPCASPEEHRVKAEYLLGCLDEINDSDEPFKELLHSLTDA